MYIYLLIYTFNHPSQSRRPLEENCIKTQPSRKIAAIKVSTRLHSSKHRTAAD